MRKLDAINAIGVTKITWGRGLSTDENGDRISLNASDFAVGYAFTEFALALLAGSIVIFLYPYATATWAQSLPEVLRPALLYALVLVALGVAKQRYVRCVTRPIWFAASSAFTDNLRAAAALMTALFILKASSDVSRISVLFQVVVVTGLTMAARGGWARWSHRRLAAGSMIVSRAVLLGDHGRLAQLKASSDFLEKLRNEGVRVASTIGWHANASGPAWRSLTNSVVSMSRAGIIDSVVLLPGASNDAAELMVEALAETPLTIYVAPLASMGLQDDLECRIGGLPAIKITNSPVQRLGAVLKRCFDIAIAATMLFLLTPLFVCIALAITHESSGPVFFRQTRHGYGGRLFKVFKFRSMRVLEDGAAFRQATKNDPRVTAIGRFIRRTNLDELPQLINVLTGDMSLVGPRPHPTALNDSFASRIRHFHRRHNIRPGITGWAQVNGYRGETDTYDKMKSRIDHDLWYVDNWSFALDLRILVSTLFSAAAYRNAG